MKKLTKQMKGGIEDRRTSIDVVADVANGAREIGWKMGIGAAAIKSYVTGEDPQAAMKTLSKNVTSSFTKSPNPAGTAMADNSSYHAELRKGF